MSEVRSTLPLLRGDELGNDLLPYIRDVRTEPGVGSGRTRTISPSVKLRNLRCGVHVRDLMHEVVHEPRRFGTEPTGFSLRRPSKAAWTVTRERQTQASNPVPLSEP